jgi:hypothetical protein
MRKNLITELKRYKELMLINESEGLLPSILKGIDNVLSGIKSFSPIERRAFNNSIDDFLTEFPDTARVITSTDDEFAKASKIASELSTSTNELAITKFLKLINSNTKLETSFVDNLLTNKPLLKDLGALEYDDFKLFLKKVGIEDGVNVKKITNSLLTDPTILTPKKIFNWAYETIKVDRNVISKNADDALVDLLTDPKTNEQFNALTKKRNSQEFLDGLYNKIIKNVTDPTYENVLTYVTNDIQKMYDELPANYKTSWINKFLKGYKFEGNKLTSLLQWYLTIGFVISGYSIIQSYKIKDALFSKWLQNKYPEWDTMTDDQKNIALSEWNEYFLSKTAQKFLYTPLWLPAVFMSDIKDMLSEKISIDRGNELWEKAKKQIEEVNPTAKFEKFIKEDWGTEITGKETFRKEGDYYIVNDGIKDYKYIAKGDSFNYVEE